MKILNFNNVIEELKRHNVVKELKQLCFVSENQY